MVILSLSNDNRHKIWVTLIIMYVKKFSETITVNGLCNRMYNGQKVQYSNNVKNTFIIAPDN